MLTQQVPRWAEQAANGEHQHYCTLELRNGDALLHFYSNQTIDFLSIVMLKDVKIWSCLQLGYKVKNRYMRVYFSAEQIFSKASCHSFNSVLQPGYKQAFSMLLLGDTYKQLSLSQVTTSPHPSWLQTLRSAYGKGHPNSQNICLHNNECSSEKHSPRSPLCLMVVSLSRRPSLSKAPALCPTAPMEAPPAPELHLTAQNQLLCTSVGLQDVLAASAFPLPHLEIYSNPSEVVRDT